MKKLIIRNIEYIIILALFILAIYKITSCKPKYSAVNNSAIIDSIVTKSVKDSVRFYNKKIEYRDSIIKSQEIKIKNNKKLFYVYIDKYNKDTSKVTDTIKVSNCDSIIKYADNTIKLQDSLIDSLKYQYIDKNNQYKTIYNLIQIKDKVIEDNIKSINALTITNKRSWCEKNSKWLFFIIGVTGGILIAK